MWQWLTASLRRAVPHTSRAPRPLPRSGRFRDLGQALSRARVRELDPRLDPVIELSGEGDALPRDPALLIAAAVAAGEGAGASVLDALLARAWPGLAAADRRRRAPMPRDAGIDDLHALVLGGLALDHPRALAWRREVLPAYWQALADAVLEDGTPADRSPATLGRLLRDALLARTLWRAAGFVSPTDPMQRLRRMARALARLSRPGLGTHRFGQAPVLAAAECEATLALAAHILGEAPETPEGPWALPTGGYFGHALTKDGVRLAVTAGRVDPARLPRHEHADLLSWELDVGGHALVVDPGPGTPGELGDHARSTRAHNVVTVGDAEQMPLFRGGWSGAPPELLEATVDPDEARFAFRGALRLPGGAVHHRTLTANAGELEVRDRVLGAEGQVVRALVHFAPDVRLQGVGRVLEARSGALGLQVEPIGVSRMDVVMAERRHPSQGWWFGPAGESTPAAALVLEADRYDGREIGCVLRWRAG